MDLSSTTHKPARCPLCRSLKLKTVYRDFVKCTDCRIIFFMHDDNSVKLDELYEKDYFSGMVYRDYIQERDFRINQFRKKIHLLEKYLPPTGMVLDIGCAMGFFLLIMNEFKYKAYGVEISKYASSYARDIMKLNVHSGDLLSAHFPDDFFNIITMWDVLEHLQNPLEVLTEIKRIMKRQGILIIETLNVDSLTARILRHKWPLYNPPYHLFYYSEKTLTGILKKIGFSLLEKIPVQTYVRTLHGFSAFRYYRYSVLQKILGIFFNDIVIFVATKSD